MKKILFLLIILLSLAAALPASADIDPILINKPNDAVFGCRNDIFIELLDQPVISKTVGGRTAEDYFLYFKAEILFLADDEWDGLDQESFSLERKTEDGSYEYYSLNYAITMITNLRYDWKTLADPLRFTSLTTYYLVFDVDIPSGGDWTLLFSPTERGHGMSYCDIEIPLNVR